MKYLSNGIDPRTAQPEDTICMPGESSTEALQRLHRWTADKIIGEPQSTAYYSAEELKRLGMVGIYLEEDEKNEIR